MDRELFNKQKVKSKDLTTGRRQGSIISPSIFNGLVAQLLTVTLLASIDILAYADNIVLISHENRPAAKLQKALNAVDKAANSLGLYFSPAKAKTVSFNTTRQSKFKLNTKRKLQIQHDQGHHQYEDWHQHQDAYSPVQVLDRVSSGICCSRPSTGLQHSLTGLRKNTKIPVPSWYTENRESCPSDS